MGGHIIRQGVLDGQSGSDIRSLRLLTCSDWRKIASICSSVYRFFMILGWVFTHQDYRSTPDNSRGAGHRDYTFQPVVFVLKGTQTASFAHVHATKLAFSCIVGRLTHIVLRAHLSDCFRAFAFTQYPDDLFFAESTSFILFRFPVGTTELQFSIVPSHAVRPLAVDPNFVAHFGT